MGGQNDYPLGIFLCEHLNAARMRVFGLSFEIESESRVRPHRRLAVAPLPWLEFALLHGCVANALPKDLPTRHGLMRLRR